jgi:hypothetical protein
MAAIIRNLTFLPHMKFSNSDNLGREFGVFMCKAAFDIEAEGNCVLSNEQEPFNFTDKTYGALNASSLRHPSDLVSYKPGTDIIVDAIGHAPDGRSAQSWISGVRVEDGSGLKLEKLVRIMGPREWRPKWKKDLTEDEKRHWKKRRSWFAGWELSEPQQIVSLPVRYEFAYGGTMPKGLDENGLEVMEAYQFNPVGRGWIDPEWTDHTKPVAAPQIETADSIIREPYKSVPPAGLGPIPPAWMPRRKFGGTFDKEWVKNTWPKWPADYDFAFNNSAPSGLVAEPHLQGALRIRLANLRQGRDIFDICVPDISPIVLVESVDADPRLVRPNLDTVFLELAADDLFDCRVTLTWRMAFHFEATEALTLKLADEADKQTLAADPRSASSAPQPSECAVPCKLLERA